MSGGPCDPTTAGRGSARAGIPLAGWSAHQAFVHSDYQLRPNLAFHTPHVTFTPAVSLLTGRGSPTRRQGSTHFHDTFAAVSIGVTFHRAAE